MSRARSYLVYVGAYTGFGPNKRGRANGVEAFTLDGESGRLVHVGSRLDVENPSFLALHPIRRSLYAVNGSPSLDGEPGGGVTAAGVDLITGVLTAINRQRTVGQGPCHAVVDRTGRWLLAACYHTGTVYLFPIRSDGGLEPAHQVVQHYGSSVQPVRQTSPHPHSVNLSPDERYLLVPDLGVDRVYSYRFDGGDGRLVANDPPWVAAEPGAGPRHLAFHPSGRYAFVVNEIGSSLTSYRYDAEAGTLKAIETVPTVPADFEGEPFTPDVQVGEAARQAPVVGRNFGADVHTAPSGQFVYASNRGHDSVVTYRFDGGIGRLALVGYTSTEGRVPRGFAIDSAGRYLIAANQGSDSLVTLELDPESGLPRPTGHVASALSPTSVLIVER